MVDLVDAQRREIAVVVGDVFLGDLEHRDAPLVGLLDQLVVDVGDVDDPGDVVAAVLQITLDRVEDHRPDHVADVRLVVDRRPAEIDADLAGPHGAKRFLLARERVVDAKRRMRGGDRFCFSGHRSSRYAHGIADR